MEDTLRNGLSDLRTFLYGGARTLPMTLAGTMLILGLFTANYAMMFFLVGFLILVPVVAWLLNGLPTLFPSMQQSPYFKMKPTDVCNVVIPYKTIPTSAANASAAASAGFRTVPVSEWSAMFLFFLSYLATNAIQLYNRKPVAAQMNITESNVKPVEDTSRRMTQSMMAFVSILVVGLIVIAMRYRSGCETMEGLLLSIVVFGALGNGWYYAMAAIGEDRLSDLFGIANRLLPPSAIANQPIACVSV